MANISPSDLPLVGAIPRGIGFCKDTNGNIIFDDGDNFHRQVVTAALNSAGSTQTIVS